jgi:small subunit ribosomal protein S6
MPSGNWRIASQDRILETALRNYELMMVVVPHLDDEFFAATLEKVNVYIGDHGGNVVGQQRWGGVRRLAYPIRSYTEGSYVVTHFEIEPEHANDLGASLMVSEDVLRHLIVKVDEFGELPGAKPRTDVGDSGQNREENQAQPSDVEQTDVLEDSNVDTPTEPQTQPDSQEEATGELLAEEPKVEEPQIGSEEEGEMEQQEQT